MSDVTRKRVRMVAAGGAIGLLAAYNPADLRALSVIVALSVIIVLAVSRRRDQTWAQADWPYLVMLAVGARLVAGCAHLVVAFIVYGGEVDMAGYAIGAAIAAANLLRGELVGTYMPELFFFSADSAVEYLLAPFYVLLGPSFLGMVFFCTLISFLASFLFLRAFQLAGPADADVRFFGKIMFFLPTFVFWSSLLGKDSIMFLCLSGVAYGVARLARGEAGVGIVLCTAACFGSAAAIRPHMGIALAAGAATAWLLRPSTLRGAAEVLRPVQGITRIAVMCAVAAVPAYFVSIVYGGVGFMVQDLVYYHNIMSLESAENVVGLGSSLPSRITGESPWEFVAFLPEGFVTALYRPLPFDVHNGQAALAAVEGTVLLVMTLRRRRQLLHAFREARSNPFMMFCLVYFLVGTWVLSFHRNLGVIVRQRTMVLPFLIMMLAASVPRREPVDEDPPFADAMADPLVHVPERPRA